MPQNVNLQLATESNPTKHGQEGAALLKNCYVESNKGEAKTKFSVYGCPGLDVWVTVAGATNVRAMLSTTYGLIAVIGRQILRFKIDGASTLIGGLGADGPVTMAENRAGHVGIVSDGQYLVYAGGASITRVQDPDLPPPLSMTEIAGYFVFAIADGRVFHTEVDDAFSISALDFFTAESKPDSNVANANLNNQLVTFGTKTTEFHGLSTDPDAPFSRVSATNVGCWARGSISEILYTADRQSAGTTIMFAATDAEGAYAGVMMLNGYAPQKLSNKYVDRKVGKEPSPDQIRSFSWTFEGHSFYCITGTTFSLVYDASEGRWHDRETWGKAYQDATCHAHFGGKSLFGARGSGVIYEENDESYSEGASPLVMTIQLPPITAWSRGVVVNAIHIDATTGTGLTSTDEENADPKLLLDYSDDGGNHWSSPRELFLGRKAQTRTKLVARNLGRVSNARTFRIRCSADVLKGVHQVQAEVTPLAS